MSDTIIRDLLIVVMVVFLIGPLLLRIRSFIVFLRIKAPFPTYVPLSADQSPPGSLYVARMNGEAAGLGIRSCGTFVANGSSASFAWCWVSDDRKITVTVTEQRLRGFELNQTSLCSALRDGRWIETLDMQLYPGLADMYKFQVLWRADFLELLALHQQRITAEKIGLIEFPELGFAEFMRAHDLEHLERTAQLGRLKFTRPDHSQWQFTFRGAAWLAFIGIPGVRKEARRQRQRLQRATSGSISKGKAEV